MIKNKRIVIVGAGMGGLTLAYALQRVGLEFVIYEQASSLAKVGAGINLAPNSTRIFKNLGLEEQIRAAGIAPKEKFSRDWKTGKAMFSYPLHELTAKNGVPFLAFHRGALQEVLYSVINNNAFRFNKKLKTLTQIGSETQLLFEDESVEVADIVIGADGVHSRVRNAIFPQHQPRYYGTVGYRALIPVNNIDGKRPEDNTKWWAPDRFVLNYFMDERREVLNMITGSPSKWEHSDWAPRKASTEELLETFKGFHKNVQGVLKGAEHITKWPMIECDPFIPWHKGGCVLLGDACHATTPHMGQGAGMSFEDAIVLMRCLSTGANDPVDVIFQRYQAMRYERTSRIQIESRYNELGRTSVNHDWLFQYDAFEMPLPL